MIHAAHGELELLVRDGETGEPLSARIQLTNAKGRRIVPKGMLALPDRSFYTYGSVVLELPHDTYQFVIDRGMEYRPRHGQFVISGGDSDHHEVDLTRFVDMAKQDWWAADLQIHTAPRLIPLQMDAEELSMVAAFAKRIGREGGIFTREGISGSAPLEALPIFERTVFDAREPGPLLLIDTDTENSQAEETELNESNLPAAAPPSLPVGWLAIDQRRDNRYVLASSALSPMLPVWLASRGLDGVCVIAPEPKSRRGWTGGPDEDFLENVEAAQRWGKSNEWVYHRMLECGLRVPPLAVSGGGWSRSPPGSSRSYAFIRASPTSDEWWRSMQRGRLMITNGPLIIIQVNGKPPGYQFSAAAGERVELTIDLTLHTKQTVEYLEIIKNGSVLHSVRLDAWAKANGRLPEVEFDESGWMLVRAVTNARDTYQYAMTAPYFVRIGDEPRISRQAVQFFQSWLAALPQGDEHARFHRAAVRYWDAKYEAATTD
ncbi:MAG: hypothetical protein AAGF97_08685 [Planctomycetota bacterium]